jgi:hypothetical protein
MSLFVELGSFGRTTVLPATTGRATFNPAVPYSIFMLRSDRDIYLSKLGDATTDDFLLPRGAYARLELLPDDSLSILLAPDQQDGTVWVTEVT